MSKSETWNRPEMAEELAEAEQLRRAIDEAGAGAGVESELEAAAMLRASAKTDAVWTEARAAQVWARVGDVDEEIQRQAATAQRRQGKEIPSLATLRLGALALNPVAGADAGARRRRRWRLGALSAAVAAVAAVVVALFAGERGAGVTRLPAPGVALLKAQTEAAARGKPIAGLSDEMRGYRSQMYAALAERYRDAR